MIWIYVNTEKNLGRTDEEIKKMKARIETELFDVLIPDERGNFNLTAVLKRVNKAMGAIGQRKRTTGSMRQIKNNKFRRDMRYEKSIH